MSTYYPCENDYPCDKPNEYPCDYTFPGARKQVKRKKQKIRSKNMKITEELIRNIFNNPEDNSEFAGEYDYNYPNDMDWDHNHTETEIGFRYIDGEIEYNLTSTIELEATSIHYPEDDEDDCEIECVEICGDARFHWFELQAYNTKTKEVENETFQLEDLKLKKKKEENLITFVDNKINELIYGYDGN